MMEGKKAGKWIVKGGFVSMKKVSCVHTHNGVRHPFLTEHASAEIAIPSLASSCSTFFHCAQKLSQWQN